jgi:hypothetical protein
MTIVGEMTDIRIGAASEELTISVADDVNREGWVDAEVTAKFGAWSGRYPAHFHETDFVRFARDLAALYSDLSGTAVLSSLDGYLDLTFTGDGLGHITVAGEAWDQPRWGSHLTIELEMDQTYLPALLASLEAVVKNLRA